MNPLDIAGHFAYASIALGMWRLGKKDKRGWILRFVGELGWIAVGLLMGYTSIWMWGILFLGIDIKGYYEWWKWEGRFADQD